MKQFTIDPDDLLAGKQSLTQHVIDVLFNQEDPRAFTAATSIDRHVNPRAPWQEQLASINDFARSAQIKFVLES